MTQSALDKYRKRLDTAGAGKSEDGQPAQVGPTVENAAAAGLPVSSDVLKPQPPRTWVDSLEDVRKSHGALQNNLASGLSLGILPFLYDKLTGGKGKDQRDIDTLNNPKMAATGDVMGFAAGPEALAAKGITKLGSKITEKTGLPFVRQATSGVGGIGGGVNAGLAGGSASFADELARSFQEDRSMNLLRVAHDAGFGAVGGNILGNLFRRTAPNVVRNTVGGRGNAAPDIPATKADPTGVIPDQPLRGPEGLKQLDEGAMASAAERLRLAAAAKAPTYQPSAELANRPAALRHGSNVHGQRVAGAETRETAADLGQKRMPGLDAGPEMTVARGFRPEVAAGQGVPGGFEGPGDSLNMWKKLRERLIDERGVAPPAARADLDMALATLERRLGVKAPATMDTINAQRAQGEYGRTWGDLAPTPAPKKDMTAPMAGLGGLIGGAAGGAGASPFGFGSYGMLGGASAGATIGAKTAKYMPELPFLSSPEKISGLLDNPAALTEALKDPTYARLLQTNLVPTSAARATEGMLEGFTATPKELEEKRKGKRKRY